MNWDDPEWQKESFEIFTQLAYEDWVREWREAKTMATREAMGRALFSSVATSGELAWERLTEQARELWCQSAEKFAAWLREQEEYVWVQVAPEPGLVCPKGHVLTHPEDIERKYCGLCREYLP